MDNIENVVVDQVRVRVLPDGRMTRDNAAAYLGIAPKTLAMWKVQGKGPQTEKVGARVFYRLSELDRFVVEGNVGPLARASL